MLGVLNKHKIVIAVVLVDLFLFWLLFYSGIVLPLINPSIEQYNEMMAKGTSFPRNTIQMLIWIFLHFPASYIVDTITKDGKFMFLSVVQTGIITYFISKFTKRRRKIKI